MRFYVKDTEISISGWFLVYLFLGLAYHILIADIAWVLGYEIKLVHIAYFFSLFATPLGIIFHELGHVVVALLSNFYIDSVNFGLSHSAVIYTPTKEKDIKVFLVHLAGPVVSIILMILSLLLTLSVADIQWRIFYFLCFTVNISASAVTLIPLKGSDGYLMYKELSTLYLDVYLF